MNVIRAMTISCWILVIGLFISYPRYRPLPDLPGPYSAVLSESVSNKSILERRLAKKREIMNRKGVITVSGTPDEILILQWWDSIRNDMRKKNPWVRQLSDLEDEKAVVGHRYFPKEEMVIGVVLTDENARKLQKASVAYAKATEEIKKQLLSGKLSSDRAKKLLWIADISTRKGLQNEPILTLRALRDHFYARHLVESRLSENCIPIIESHRGTRVKGYLVDSKRTVVLPFMASMSDIPRGITLELRRWDLAKGFVLKGIWLVSFLTLIILTYTGRLYTWSNKRPLINIKSEGESGHSNNNLLRDKIDLIRSRKTGYRYADSNADIRPRPDKAICLVDLIDYLPGVIAVLFCVGLSMWTDTASTQRESSLKQFIHQQALRDEYVVVRYSGV